MKKFLSIFTGSILLLNTAVYALTGDVNNDDTVDSKDASLVLSMETGKEEKNPKGDVNFDDEVNAKDASLILQYTAGLIDKFKVPGELPEGFSPVPTVYTKEISVSTYEELKSAISELGTSSEQRVIYITEDIYPTAQIKLDKANANINFVGVTKSDGTAPKLDFYKFRDSLTNRGSGGTGLMISGSYYNFKNLIVTNAGDCGTRIKGSSAGNCIFENCIFNYNNNSGISVTEGGHDNTFIGVDSYRNCDLCPRYGADADGFSIKLGAGDGNKCYSCRAWENGDDGWDSYDQQQHNGVYNISYIDCLCWHNGDLDTFTCWDDYERGLPADERMLYIQAAIEQEPNFLENYNNKVYTKETWPNVTIKLLGSTIQSKNIDYNHWEGNPNGFKFGSEYSNPEQYRYVENCIAFENGQKGFDMNNSACKIDINNTIGYDNGFDGKKGQDAEDANSNYILKCKIRGVTPVEMQVLSSSKNYSFDGKNPDVLPDNMTTTEPTQEQQAQIRAKVDEVFGNIKDLCYEDKIAGVVTFDEIFEILR